MCLDLYCVNAHPKATSQHCVDCDVPCMGIGEYYMVTDEVWLEAGCSLAWCWGMVCIACLEDRLGRTLCHDDFTGAPVNWYDRVVRRGDRMLDRIWNEVPNEVPDSDSDLLDPASWMQRPASWVAGREPNWLHESERNLSV